VQILLTEIFRW